MIARDARDIAQESQWDAINCTVIILTQIDEYFTYNREEKASCEFDNQHVVKFADGTVIVSMLQLNNAEMSHGPV